MGDLISRQALCEYALNQKDKSVTPNDIMRFPSAQTERKKGNWVNQKGGGCCCSECGRYALDEINGNFIHVAAKSNFCPNCGAEMKGEIDG